MAKSVGLRAATVSNLCTGKTPIGKAEVGTLVTLAKLAGCSLDELIIHRENIKLIETGIKVIDLFANYYHPLAKVAKNVAAGAVLISAINAVVVGYLIFFDRLKPITGIIVEKVKQSPPHITFIILTVVMLIVIGVKAYFGKGTPLKGGMPSGHSAIAFSIASIISLTTKDTLIASLSYIMALLVAQTRVESKIHSVLETVIGAVIGILVSVIIFQLFQ
jgi:diacylglycerol kinase (ATP)